jgi:hypothetical protein
MLHDLVECSSVAEGWHTDPTNALFWLNLKCSFGGYLVHLGGRESSTPEETMLTDMSSAFTSKTIHDRISITRESRRDLLMTPGREANRRKDVDAPLASADLVYFSAAFVCTCIDHTILGPMYPVTPVVIHYTQDIG